jgi:hypothetical protein
MNGDELDLLIESTAGAWREHDVNGRALPPPAWWDLPPDGREAAFEAQAATRELERAIDPHGLSGTVRAVMERLNR